MRDTAIDPARLPERIVVVGTTGAGKTTLARSLAHALDAAHVELDACFWDPGWEPAPRPVFLERLRRALAAPRWVADGNYSLVCDEIWSRADAIVWLDFSLGVILARLLPRTVRRAWRREELWSGNRETFRQSFLSRDSVLWWAIRTHARRSTTLPDLLGRPEYRRLRVVRLRCPAAAEQFVRRLLAASASR